MNRDYEDFQWLHHCLFGSLEIAGIVVSMHKFLYLKNLFIFEFFSNSVESQIHYMLSFERLSSAVTKETKQL